MKYLRTIVFAGVISIFVLSACLPQLPTQSAPIQSAPTEPPPPAQPPTEPPKPADTAVPATEPPAATATTAPPPMAVGSTYRYFDGALLVAVPNQGPFIMGSSLPDNPKHEVTVGDFWIYSVEVSNQMYAWCESLGKCLPPDPDDNPVYVDLQYANYPVVGVDWQQAAAYCDFAHGRLPTEAEWEKAASWDAANNTKRIFPWGNQSPSCNLMNYGTCVNRSSPVYMFDQGKSFYGLLNMAGNVFEWAADWYQANYASSAAMENPIGPPSGTKRSVRSSGFTSDSYLGESARRFFSTPTDHRKDMGFRCVVQDPTYFAPFCEVPVSYGPNAPGAGNQGVPSFKPCPDPSIEHHDGCTQGTGGGNVAVDFVTVHNTAPTTVDVFGLDACSPASNDVEVGHQCSLGLIIKVDPKCSVAPSGSPGCPVGYSLLPGPPDKCVAKGGPGSCPTGYDYDTSLQCCQSIPGVSKGVPLCSVGQHLYNGVCVSDGSGPLPPSPLVYITNSGLNCSPGGKPNQPGGPCPPGFHWGCITSGGQQTYPQSKCGCIKD